MSTIDIEAVRADTTGCRVLAHLNNAGASLIPNPVLMATIDYLEAEAAAGGYELEARRSKDLERFYHAGARLLGCGTNEIAFTNSATESWAKAVAAMDLKAGDRVLVSSAESVSSVFSLTRLRQQGVVVQVIPHEPNGQVSVDKLADLLDDDVKLVAVTHIPTQGGLVNPVAEIGSVLADSDALYLVDASQSLGQVAVSVGEISCDILVGSGRKFLRGPRGTGLLYVRSDVLDRLSPVGIDARSAQWLDSWQYELAPGATRFETFEVNQAAKVGFGHAIEYALAVGIDSIDKRTKELSDGLRDRLDRAPLIDVIEGNGLQSAIVTFRVTGQRSEAVVTTLRAWGINTSVVPSVPSKFDPVGLTNETLVRASVHYFNTEEELDLLLAAL